ncbi:MAG: glycoside hydrolase family 28 protein [Verrucomicrobia bacterium]|nr:glycoside hydrolase family 28 protein [Verrucomicrobiota bacterium]
MKHFLLVWLVIPLGLHGAEFDVRKFGAKGDRETLDQPAIQAALDACAKAGGGTVKLPPGDYLSGTLRFASGVTLELARGATLWASTNRAHYIGTGKTSGHLLVASNVSQIAVVGQGTINGQGAADYGDRWGVPKKPEFRVGILLFTACTNITVRNVTVRNSDAWTLHFKRCEHITVDGVTIRNNYRRLNSDGIDPNSCRHVRITRCHIIAGDDCIVLKSTEPHPCEDVVVSDCQLESAASALKLGTESHGDFRNIRFERCVIRNSPTGIGLYLKDGAAMENIAFTDIELTSSTATNRVITPIFMDIEKRHPHSKIGTMRNITFENISMHSGSSVLIQGMPESPIENLTLRNLKLQVTRPDDFAKRKKPVGGRRTTREERDALYAQLPTYFALAHIRNLTLEDVTVNIAPEAFARFERSAVSGRDIVGGTIRNVRRIPGATPGRLPVIDLQDCRDVTLP